MFPLGDTNPTIHRSWVNLALIAICVAVFIGPQQAAGPIGSQGSNDFVFAWAAIPCEVTSGLGLTPVSVQSTVEPNSGLSCELATEPALWKHPFKPVRLALVTSIFMHGGWLHLLGNMWFLKIFGDNIEDHFGHFRYLIFYILGGLGAGLAHVAAQPDSAIPVVGASGAIAAVMGAYFIWFPKAPISTLFVVFPIRITARWWLGFWFISQFFTSPDARVAWVAHVGGFVFGALLGALVRYSHHLRQLVFTAPYRGHDVWDDSGQLPNAYIRPPLQQRR